MCRTLLVSLSISCRQPRKSCCLPASQPSLFCPRLFPPLTPVLAIAGDKVATGALSDLTPPVIANLFHDAGEPQRFCLARSSLLVRRARPR